MVSDARLNRSLTVPIHVCRWTSRCAHTAMCRLSSRASRRGTTQSWHRLTSTPSKAALCRCTTTLSCFSAQLPAGRPGDVHVLLVAWLVIMTADDLQESMARALKFIQFLAEIYWPYTNYQVSPVLPLYFSTRRCFTAIASAAAS